MRLAHEQKAQGGAVDRRGQQESRFATLVGHTYQTIPSIMEQVFRRL